MSGTVHVGCSGRQTAFVLLTELGAVNLVGACGRSWAELGRRSVDIALTRAADRAARCDRMRTYGDERGGPHPLTVRSGRGRSGRPAQHGRTGAYRSGRHRPTNLGITASSWSSSCAGVIVATPTPTPTRPRRRRNRCPPRTWRRAPGEGVHRQRERGPRIARLSSSAPRPYQGAL